MTSRMLEDQDAFCECGEPLLAEGEKRAGRCVECIADAHEEHAVAV